VETPVQDDTKTANDLSPIQAQRSWDRQAEDNVVDRLERIGLMAPRGEVDKVLETVVNNLEVTNNIDVDPEVRCRVMMTSTLGVLHCRSHRRPQPRVDRRAAG